jgi:hypothetical protein
MKSETYYTIRAIVRGAFWTGLIWLTLALLAAAVG